MTGVVKMPKTSVDPGGGNPVPVSPIHDPVDHLRDHCRKVIASMEGTKKELALAKSKLDEMVYWLRLARQKDAA